MVSQLWYELLRTAKIPLNGTIVEVAPGFKSKVGRALAELDFSGDYHLIEPNRSALEHSVQEYQRILPRATIHGHQKCLQEIEIGRDIPQQADALLANHALDDLVLAIGTPPEECEEFFSMNSGLERITRTRELWEAINQKDVMKYVSETVKTVLSFLSQSRPQLAILSHYQGKTLAQQGIHLPNEIGSLVAQELQRTLDAQPPEPYHSILKRAGYGLDWVIQDNRIRKDIFVRAKEQPQAITRLHPEIFVEERARKLEAYEFEVVYTNNSLLKGLGLLSTGNQDEIDQMIGECFAYTLSDEIKPEHRIVYADRQADPTDIALSGNEGSGRACYIGSDFNSKGIGRTKLVRNPKDSLHGTGTLDLVTALREAIISNFISQHTTTGTSPVLAVLALKDTTKYVWCDQPLRNGLLIRRDDGSLDRISHLAYAPATRPVNVDELIDKYALFDAEMFAHRILHGAWSIGNSSLQGQWLDLESASFIQGRGARCNITKKYLSNYFGYESLGIKQAIDQLITILGLPLTKGEWEPRFDQKRDERLTYETLRLLGISPREIPGAMNTFPKSHYLAGEFEALAKKISPRKMDLNVFGNDAAGTHLLDFSELFRNFPPWYRKNVDWQCYLPCLIRSEERQYCLTDRYSPENPAEKYLATHAVIEEDKLSTFTDRTEEFLWSLVDLTAKLDEAGYLPKQEAWELNAEYANRNYPNFEQLTIAIRNHTKKYEEGRISAQELNRRLGTIL